METIGRIDIMKERGRFRHNKRESRYLAVAQFLQRRMLAVIRDLGIDMEKAEQACCGQRRVAALHIDVYELS